ncbi:MAG: FKBP-type peptidyl-prolyl cis-trans isomerase [Spirochaetota bacterium]
MEVAHDRVVTIAYTLKDPNGNVIDSSENHGDLAYLHGHSNIVEGLEDALEGKDVGDTVETTVQPEKGYGERHDQLVFTVPRSSMPDGDLEVGMQFAAQDKEGNQQVVTLVDVDDEEVKLDANHPLAGQTLHFDVTVNDVREASGEELEHGHVHTPDSPQH